MKAPTARSAGMNAYFALCCPSKPPIPGSAYLNRFWPLGRLLESGLTIQKAIFRPLEIGFAMANFTEQGLIVAVIEAKPGKGQGVRGHRDHHIWTWPFLPMSGLMSPASSDR